MEQTQDDYAASISCNQSRRAQSLSIYGTAAHLVQTSKAVTLMICAFDFADKINRNKLPLNLKHRIFFKEAPRTQFFRHPQLRILKDGMYGLGGVFPAKWDYVSIWAVLGLPSPWQVLTTVVRLPYVCIQQVVFPSARFLQGTLLPSTRLEPKWPETVGVRPKQKLELIPFDQIAPKSGAVSHKDLLVEKARR